MMINFSARRQRGFSLVELMVALLVAAVGFIAIGRFQVTILRGGSETQVRSEAIQIAKTQLEGLKTYANWNQYNQITPLTPTTVLGSMPKYTQYTLNQNVNINTNPEFRNVTVTVSWSDTRGDQQSVVLDTIIGWVDPWMSAAATM